VGTGGFQEQIVYLPTPEPRAGIWVLIGLFGLGACLLRKVRVASSGNHSAS
jgi:hypothetical protein